MARKRPAAVAPLLVTVVWVVYTSGQALVSAPQVAYRSVVDIWVTAEPVLAEYTSVLLVVDTAVSVTPEQMLHTSSVVGTLLHWKATKMRLADRLMLHTWDKMPGWFSVRSCNLNNMFLVPLKVDHNPNKKYRQVHKVYYRRSSLILPPQEPLASAT
jgi:hypothetical protein